MNIFLLASTAFSTDWTPARPPQGTTGPAVHSGHSGPSLLRTSLGNLKETKEC